MKTIFQSRSIWVISTFSLLALFLWSVTNPVHPNTTNEKEKSEANYSPVSADPFIGEIILFGGNFAPRGWALCDGQILPIAQNTALFSLLGTTYGGDGRTTFALPDLRGRVAVHAGRGPGLSSYKLGQRGGSEFVPVSSSVTVKSNNSGDSKVVSASSPPANIQPYNTVNYIIALQGVFPSRS